KTYTFDPKLNLNMNNKDKSQHYDRIFFRSPATMNNQFKSVHMELEGTQHIKTLNVIFCIYLLENSKCIDCEQVRNEKTTIKWKVVFMEIYPNNVKYNDDDDDDFDAFEKYTKGIDLQQLMKICFICDYFTQKFY
ncbi:unnamed protein product, partial [Rotaria sordida]